MLTSLLQIVLVFTNVATFQSFLVMFWPTTDSDRQLAYLNPTQILPLLSFQRTRYFNER